MDKNVESELLYRVGILTEKLDDVEKDLAIANKMIRLLTLQLVSETPVESVKEVND